MLFCTSSINATDIKTVDNNYLDYFDSYNDNDQIKLIDFFHYLFKLKGIDESLVNKFIFKPEYRIDSYGYNANTTRLTALIDLMRAYMIIPDINSIEYYPWTDIPESDDFYSISDIELAYVSYARELGITKGISMTEFGFTKNITVWQLKTFIKNIENLSINPVEFPLEYSTNDNIKNLDKLALPLIIEYMQKLPEPIKNKIINDNWKFYFSDDNIPNQDKGIIGITDSDNHNISLITLKRPGYNRNFTEIMVHEFGHVIHYLSNISPFTEQIIFIEKPKLANDYIIYANTNKNEFVACAWAYLYFKGDEYFSAEYPGTYEFIQDMISRIE